MGKARKFCSFDFLKKLVAEEKNAEGAIVMFCGLLVVFSIFTWGFCQFQIISIERLSVDSQRTALMTPSMVF